MNNGKDGHLDFVNMQPLNRKHKDRLFRLTFRERDDLLSLYNAIRGTAYQNPDDLTITTLEDVIYLGMKNDVSFIVGSTMNLYEHQSTWNENMPLRGLIYFAGLYQEYVSRNGYNLFGVKRIRLPAPQYIVFYNGLLEKPDKEVMHLSDAFYPEGSDKKHCLECEAVILNINRGHNPELLKKCKKLWEYTEFVSRMREYLQQGYELRTAASTVITECLRNGILVDVLTRCRTEVLEMLLTEYNEAETMEYLRKEAQEIGWAEGHAKGHAEGRAEGHAEGHAEGRAEGHAKGLEDGIKILVSVLQEEEIPQRRIVEKLIQKYSLSEEAAIQYVNHHEK